MSPSFESCKDWKAYGATVAKKEDIETLVKELRKKSFDKVLIIVNRYDGIDLPDDSCRILVMDNKPHPETLADRYLEACRANSEIISIKIARTIEQGMGRAVRGEKDYCVVILIGADLINMARGKETKKYLSPQTQMQIDIGLEIASLAKEEIANGIDPMTAFTNLISQCLKRDEGWKDFYAEQMDKLSSIPTPPSILHVFSAEMHAESKYLDGDYDEAVDIVQDIINRFVTEDSEKGWYLQEIARYLYPKSKSESNSHQLAAHQKNHYLLKPKTGMKVTKISITSQKRIENIVDFISSFSTFEELSVALEDILSHLRFMIEADKFERAFNDFGTVLGFKCQRPDKEWKEGPDNLWALKDGHYLLVECKSEVDTARAEINKDETGQMNNACSWFEQYYPGAEVKRIMIVPPANIARGAGFNEPVEIMNVDKLAKLVANAKAFFNEFKSLDLKDLSQTKVQEYLNFHELGVDDILVKYSVKVKPRAK